MKTYRVTLACNMRAYATVEIEASSALAAERRAFQMANALNGNSREEFVELDGVVFKPDSPAIMEEYDVVSDIEEQ